MSADKPVQPKQVKIELPGDLEPKYANFFMITHTPAEIIIDCAQVLPRAPKGKVQNNLAQYESKFGAIQTFHGPTLADTLFKQSSPPTKKE
jgi:hypothetical protein